MYKVLLVDDEDIVINGMKSKIDWKSIDVEICGCAYDGTEALEMVKIEEPDIIISDVSMPIMDGITMIQHLNELGCKSECLILSGHSNFEYAQKAIQYGVSNYLLKPCGAEDILCAVKEVIHKLEQSKEAQYLVKNLTQINENNHALLKSSLFTTMLRNSKAATPRTIQLFTDLLPEIGQNPFRIAYIALPEQISSPLLNQCKNICKKIITTVQRGIVEEYDGHTLVALIIELNKHDISVYESMQQQMASLAPSTKETFAIYISKSSNVASNIPELFEQAVVCSNNSYLFSQNVLTYDMLDNSNQINVEAGSATAKVLNYIDKHYNENFSLQDLSDNIYLTPNYITTLFKKDTGTTFKRYLTKVRMDHAKKLLQDSNIRIADIAAMVGYDSDEYFCKVFKKTHNLTPSEYRQSNIV